MNVKAGGSGPTPQPATEALARRAAEGDTRAFEGLVTRIRPRLALWIESRMGPLLRGRLQPEDVFQETMVQVVRSLEAFVDQGPGSFSKWLFSVAEHRMHDLHKHHAAERRHPRREASPALSDAQRQLMERVTSPMPSPGGAAHRQERLRRLAEAVRSLPDPYREVLILRGIQEATLHEVSEKLRRPLSTVQGQFVRALGMLRDALDTGLRL